jgi:hypothetical protein
MAKQESANTGQRVADKKAELASKGLPAGGKRAFCYEPDGVTIRESEAKTYRKAARDVLAGKAWSAVAREWNDAGIAPPQAKKWSVTTVRYVLTSPRHAGLRVHRGKVQKQPAAWPGVIDLPTHEALVAAVKGGDQPRRRSLLTRLVVCDCGAPMTRDGRSFRCRACGSTVKADALENLIEEMVIELLGNSTRLAKVMANQGDEPDDAALDILRAEHKLAEAADLYAADEIGRKEWLRVRKVTQARLRDARRRLRRRTDANALERFRLEQHPADLYRKLDTDERRAVISAVIDRIVIAPARNRAPRLDPGRVRPIWRA